MLGKSFSHLKALEKTLDAAWLRNEAVSNNIANVNTPNYKRSDVEFEKMLKSSMSAYTIQGSVTHEKHMPIGVGTIDQIEPTVTTDFSTKYRKDGNNVNIDVEMAELAKNTIRYNMLTQRLSGELRKLKMVIKDGR
ncbi:MAG: flagellar basal body rod protein FlgB [Bacillota bacterium]